MRDLDFFEWLCLAVVTFILGVVGLLVHAIYLDAQRPTFELKRDDWVCTKSEQRTRLQATPAGKSLMLLPMQETVCVEYVRTKP